MKTPNHVLTELTLDLTTHELQMRPLVTLWSRVGGFVSTARLESVWAQLKNLRAAIDAQEQQMCQLRAVADSALDEVDQLRRELVTLKLIAFANRPTVIFAEGVTQ